MAKKNVIVKASYLFPNWMVTTYGFNGEQIPDLQGEYNIELHQKIIDNSDRKTKMHGFPILKEDK